MTMSATFPSKATIGKTPAPRQTTTITLPESKRQEQQEQKTQEENRMCEEEMTSEVKNDLDKQQRKDFDNDNVNQNDHDINNETPSFIRLFVIRRIIDNYIKNNKNTKKDKKEMIKELANVFKDDRARELLVVNILTQLINDGIKEYMCQHYKEIEESNIIEDIFNKIILKKFGQEYYEIMKYGINNDATNNNYYKNLLFNSSDLMNQIFQYLQWGEWFNDDLYSCSLVSSHWLYHVWNVNSVYYIDFSGLVKNYNKDTDRACTRIWQRLYNVKSIYISFDADIKAELATLNKLLMLRKVEKVYALGKGEVGKCIPAVIPIMRRFKERIKYCTTHIGFSGSVSSDFEAPSPLRLPKAQYVDIGNLYFYQIWTNECTRLKLSYLNNISKNWCKFVIENCDCSNITNLTLDNVMFEFEDKVILKQLALKFYNLKTLEIVICLNVDENVLLFWQLLKRIISKNTTKVKLTVYHLVQDAYNLLNKTMDEKDLKIDTFIIGNITSSTIKSIQERDRHGLKHLAFLAEICYNERKKLLNVLKCKSIITVELKDRNIKSVNRLLEWKVIVEKQIFVIIDVYGYYTQYSNNSNDVLSLFQQFYQNVYQLFMQQIALDIKIEFRKVQDSKVFESCLSLYSSYFENSQFLSKYNSPNCNNNNLCLPRDKPYTYFYINDSQKDEWERYCVFRATNVQMK